MTAHYLLHPRAPLVFGTGKPMDFGLGGETLRFPFPATVSGAMRAALATEAGRLPDPFDSACADIPIGPPLLAVLDGKGVWVDTRLPRPADAAYVAGEVIPLQPAPLTDEQDGYIDLPAGLKPLALKNSSKEKLDLAPAWWGAQAFAEWLVKPSVMKQQNISGAMAALPMDQRAHVVIGAEGAAEAGGLFRSAGVDFGMGHGDHDGQPAYALAASVGDDHAAKLNGHHRRVGGEGRPARMEAATPPRPWPCRQPPGLAQAKRIRLVLISPAVFTQGGYLPDGFEPKQQGIEGIASGVSLRIYACALERPSSYSGWQTNGPGQAFRVVPAGTIYWCEVLEGDPCRLWNQSLCAKPWCDSGWGFVLPGLV